MAQFPTNESASGIWKLKDIWVAIRGDNWVKDLSGNRGLFAGGDLSPGYSNVIDYIGIASTGNATDFGDLITGVYGANSGAIGSTTRGIFAGGGEGSAGGTDEISYVTIASAGNATDFGNLSESGRAMGAGMSSSTRGVIGPRRDSSRAGTSDDNSDTIDYVTIASTGNATDFGNATVKRANNAGACSSTRGLIGGGNLNTQPGGESSNVMDYITIASAGNATDFGDLSAIKHDLGGLSSSTRALFAGGTSNPGSSPYGSLTNSIDYVTIATTGDATDFGDLGASTASVGLSNTVRGVFSESSASTAGSMTYITIASTGNVTTFGDLSVARQKPGSGSNIHGGLQ